MLKPQYFGYLMPRANSLEKTMMLGKIEGRRRSGQQKKNPIALGLCPSRGTYASYHPPEGKKNPLQGPLLQQQVVTQSSLYTHLQQVPSRQNLGSKVTWTSLSTGVSHKGFPGGAYICLQNKKLPVAKRVPQDVRAQRYK